MKILDTNMILRYLFDDNQTMAEQVENLINNYPVFVTPEVIAEVVYVMKGVYKQERSVTSKGIIEFMEIDNIKADHAEAIIKALQLYGDNNLDFVDCLLCAYHIEYGHEICTFDKKLNKIISKSDAI